MYFAGRPKQPKTGRTKEVVKSAALSDEKSAKLSKAEEEAEAKKKKMEAERARLQALKAPELPMKTHDITLESRIGKVQLKQMVEKIRRERLGIPEDVALELEKKPKKVQTTGEKVIKQEIVSQSQLTLNTIPKRERPSLRNKVGNSQLIFH